MWSKKSCLGPAEIASFLFLVLFKNGGCRVTQGFMFLFLMLIKGTEAGWVQNFLVRNS